MSRPDFPEVRLHQSRDCYWPTARRIYCPAGCAVAYVFISIGIGANLASLLSFLVGVVGVLTGFLIGGSIGAVVTGVSIALAYILDCADGTIARYNRSQSDRGALLDYALDTVLYSAVLSIALLCGDSSSRPVVLFCLTVGGINVWNRVHGAWNKSTATGGDIQRTWRGQVVTMAFEPPMLGFVIMIGWLAGAEWLSRAYVASIYAVIAGRISLSYRRA